jgi:uncharacterized protein YbjT (DUF2867 family)
MAASGHFLVAASGRLRDRQQHCRYTLKIRARTAVANSRTLSYAARRAGVQRIVHVSITHPAIDSPYPHFRGKAEVERVLAEAGVSSAVIRPAILFGGDGCC